MINSTPYSPLLRLSGTRAVYLTVKADKISNQIGRARQLRAKSRPCRRQRRPPSLLNFGFAFVQNSSELLPPSNETRS
jgi:hypothetical protein